jgi:hypothetical protein
MDPIALATAIVGLITAYFGARSARAEYRTAEKKDPTKLNQTDEPQLEVLLSRIETARPQASSPLETLRLEPHHDQAVVQLTAELGHLFSTDERLANLAEATYETLSRRNSSIYIANSGAVAFEGIKMQGKYVAGRDLHLNSPPD